MAFKLVVAHHADKTYLAMYFQLEDGVGFTLHDGGSNPSIAPKYSFIFYFSLLYDIIV